MAMILAACKIESMVEKRCLSKYKFSKFIYHWTIEGFQTKLSMNEKTLHSLPFVEQVPRKLTWQLAIVQNTCNNSLAFSLKLVSGDGAAVNALLDFSIRSSEEDEAEHQLRKKIFYKDYVEWFAYDRNTVLSAAKSLTVSVEIYVEMDELHSQFQVDNPAPVQKTKVDGLKLLQGYAPLLESGSFSDVTLTVGEETFRAHKAILAAQSPVFGAMFQHDLMENSEGAVTITDIEPEVFKELLRFIYTGTVSSSTVMDTMALELLMAAEKYDLDQLKVICVENALESLDVETAAEALIVAELCNVADLKAQAIDFIKAHTAKVMLTSGWFKMAAYPELLKEFATEPKD